MVANKLNWMLQSFLPDCLFSSVVLLLLRSYDHALDPESGSVDEVGGRHQVFFGAPKLVSQRYSVVFFGLFHETK